MSGFSSLNLAEHKTPLLLVIDDDAVVRSMLCKALKKQGYDVIEAINGSEGVDLFRHHRPDMVLLDVLMPVMNGFEACQMMRELDPERSVPVIMLTGLDDVSSVDRAFDVGATDFITKPINWTLFAQRVRYAIKSREMDFELRKNRHRVDHALKVAMLGYWDWNLTTNEFYIPAGVMDMLSIERGCEPVLEELIKYVPEEDRDRVRYAFEDARDQGARFVIEHKLQGADRKERYVYQQCDVIMGEDKKPSYILGTIQDITAIKRAEDMILHQAYHDLLTDLPNQTLFKERLTHALKVAEHAQHQVAVVTIDIDRFQLINESLGHDVGNELMVAFAGFLSGYVYEGDTVARISGDEFSFILESPNSMDEVNDILSGLQQALRENAFDLAGQQVFITLSIGVAMYPDDDLTPGGLIQCSNSAMRRAKARGGDQEQFYTHDMNRRIDDRLRMESELRYALENGDIEVYYQPQMDVSSRKIVAVESLARWNHKEQGLIPPIRFIPLAEESGLIQLLGQTVLDQSFRQAKIWADNGYEISVGVNLSARQFMQDNLVDQIQGLLQVHRLDPSKVDLEITETIAMQDAENGIRKMRELKKIGVNLSMDDFGTGYSSLSYLHRFPLDILKIDRSFVQDIRGDNGDGAIARAVIAMSESMGLKVIAEGVENEEQLAFLKKYGCERIQGYLVSPPLKVSDFDKLYMETNRV